MASELFFCEICGIQVRRVGDGVNPLPEDFDRACPDHLLEWRAMDSAHEAQQAEALADGAKEYEKVAKKAAVDAAKAWNESPEGPGIEPDRIDNVLPEEPLPGKPPEPPLGGSRTSTSGGGSNVSTGSSTSGSSTTSTVRRSDDDKDKDDDKPDARRRS